MMTKKKLEIKIESFGIYSKWDKNSKSLPKILKFTEKIPAKVDTEFGYILNIRGGKGKKVDFIIDHPPFIDKYGNITPSFTGEVHINSNDYRIYLGDYIWEPENDKLGQWKIEAFINEKLIASKIFTICSDI